MDQSLLEKLDTIWRAFLSFCSGIGLQLDLVYWVFVAHFSRGWPKVSGLILPTTTPMHIIEEIGKKFDYGSNIFM